VTVARVTDYELYEVPPRWLFLRVETSDGRVGWGEPIVEGRAHTVRAAVEELFETYLLGEDPHPVADHWQRMYRGGFYRGGPVLMSAIAGVDQALWDLRGKAFDAPVHELLGGPVRDRMRVYQWVHGDTPAELEASAADAVAAGYGAVKMNATAAFRRVESPAAVAGAVERVEAVRETVGPGVDVGVDFHGRVSQSMAPRLAEALESAEPMFVEEPVRPEHVDALPQVAAHTTTPIATGERVLSRFEFKPLFEDGVVDVAQPDLSHAGGITEVTKIADMAEAYDVALAPHCPLGPLALAACLQVDAVAHNALVQEQSLDVHDEDGHGLGYLADPSAFGFDGGFVDLPDAPGLGVEVDEAVVEVRAGDVDWHPPAWRHDDGSVAEW
jgi:galactonate dehydratase